MKFLIILALLAAGCSTPRDYNQLTKQVAEYGVQVIHVKETNDNCFVYRDNDGSAMSCVPAHK